MTTNPAHDDASEAANQPAPAGQSSAITLRPSPALAAEFPALNHALVFLGDEPLEVSAPAPALPKKRAADRRRKSRAADRARRKSRRAIARPMEPETPLQRHERKCVICHHPERETIEEFFVRWQQPHRMAQEYDLPVRSLYRHAHATGLFAARRRNLRSVLEYILEDASVTQVTGDSHRPRRARLHLPHRRQQVGRACHSCDRLARVSRAAAAKCAPNLIDIAAIRK